MPWPSIIRVTFTAVDGREASYTSLTYLGDLKAVAMATEEHVRQGRWPILDVALQSLGPAPKNPDGTVGEGPPGVLEDRMEF